MKKVGHVCTACRQIITGEVYVIDEAHYCQQHFEVHRRSPRIDCWYPENFYRNSPRKKPVQIVERISAQTTLLQWETFSSTTAALPARSARRTWRGKQLFWTAGTKSTAVTTTNGEHHRTTANLPIIYCSQHLFQRPKVQKSLSFISFVHPEFSRPRSLLWLKLSFRKFCSVCGGCGKVIVPRKGETKVKKLRALGKDFHLNCFKCEVDESPDEEWVMTSVKILLHVQDCSLVLSPGTPGKECWPIKNHLLCKK